ncbi:proto-oncogene Mas-like [Mercenaria mercenaria]|uniref:proto-oncogene Mas-like n=1 Tax=Mercenaria mercenaria TaxID=6596 RepID=UPI00234E4988|nr:proto-oncogene Mas-like [Mercenaria mercenaria]
MKSLNNLSRLPETNNGTEYTVINIAEQIWTFLPPIIMFVGTVGNVTTVIVYIQPSMRTSAFAIYAIALAISDTTALYSGLLFDWLVLAFDINVIFVSSTGCKVIIWLVYTSVCYSAWIITAITIERVFVVWFPLWSRRRNDKMFSRILICCLVVICMALNSHFLFGMVLDTEQSMFHRNCGAANQSYWIFFQRVWPWISTNLFCFIPSSLIIVGNMMIVLKVSQCKQNDSCETVRKDHLSSRKRHANIQDHRAVLVLPILLTLNIMFLITTLPINLYLLILNYSDVLITDEYSERKAQNYLCWTILNMLLFSNNAVNCILYCLSGSNFRRELLALCCGKS